MLRNAISTAVPCGRGAFPAAPGDVTASLDVTELLRQAANGDPAAWDEIVGRYGGLVSAKIRTFRLQDADALDAMQLTWLRLAENIHRIQHPERLGGWLATTAARACLRILHQATRTQPITDTMVDTLADASASPEQQVIDTHGADTAYPDRRAIATPTKAAARTVQ